MVKGVRGTTILCKGTVATYKAQREFLRVFRGSRRPLLGRNVQRRSVPLVLSLLWLFRLPVRLLCKRSRCVVRTAKGELRSGVSSPFLGAVNSYLVR